ncbi:MAG: MarR family transcriptional regulator [Scytolyngbya sp. HA4215-MV1]|nr:MarR family transcriptional regulator [Scytolyngbya sp. HA4215-MV1]
MNRSHSTHAEPSEALSASKRAAQETFLTTVRELVHTYQAFLTYDEAHIRQLGLTVPQFDVIATLGNTSGMMMGQLAEKTLTTKGTLTGIVDRLEKKGLVRREVPPDNRRCFKIVLTQEGEQMFEQVFPDHIAYLKARFDLLSAKELEEARVILKRLGEIFVKTP